MGSIYLILFTAPPLPILIGRKEFLTNHNAAKLEV